MRQRASSKTQRRLKQQQIYNPYALTDDVYCEAPTFCINGPVTVIGLIQVVTILALSSFMFGSTLLFCAVLVVTIGLVTFYHSNTKAIQQGMGLKQTINRLLTLRQSALDYSLTLSIAQSNSKYKQQKQRTELQIAMLPSSPTPQKVVATMILNEEEALKIQEKRKIKQLVDIVSLMTLSRLNMMPLPKISLILRETTEALIMEKPRANSEPKQVLRSRPLLLLKAKVQNSGLAQEKTTQERPTCTVLKTSSKQEKKTTNVDAKATTTPFQQQTIAFEAPNVSAKKHIQPRVVLELKVAISSVLPKPKAAEVVSPTTTVNVEPVAFDVKPLRDFPKPKPLIEIAYGEPANERELVVTRKVLLYLNANAGSVVNLDEQDLEQESKCKQDVACEHKPEDFALSLEAFPPLSSPIVPQVSLSLPTTDVVEPNFLMDIELEPIVKPEKNMNGQSVLHPESVGSADLRSMVDELDAMRLELDAAMACCTSLLYEREKMSTLALLKLKPEEDTICCC
ncbi:unnamed protein product [Peronospora belbahrii]|uniref:Uncharacterized protein n=1 Tax=Peronospora belbahrii TaxID=622444 RepID=A0ABN8D9H1_9STRA|nr:unnamed protein product [Peronospora belbahrii]